MLTCRRVTGMATARAEGGLGLLGRLRFDRHLAGCPACRTYARQLEVAARTVARLPDPDLPAELDGALMAGFDAAMARPSPASAAAGMGVEARRREPSLLPPIAGAAAVTLVLLAIGKQRSHAPGDWLVAAVLASTALSVAALAHRASAGLVLAAAAIATAAALLAGGAGPLAADHGVTCISLEIASAAVAGGGAWLAIRGRTGTGWLRSFAAGAVAGALAADAALQITCGAHGSVPHLLAFHVGGVAMVVGLALLALRRQVAGPGGTAA